MRGSVAFLLLFAFAPFVETLIMAALLTVLARFMSPTFAVLISAALWGIAHSLQAAVWGLVIWWPFVIFSTLYMVWRERSVVAALGVATATHALQNLLPALKIAFG
jgi:membrane protease YdiL (CAAX protease family)